MQLSVSTPEPQVDQGGAMPSVLGCVPPPAEVVAPRWLSKQEVNRGGGTDEEENQGRSLQEAVARQPQPGKQFSSSSRWSGAEFTPNPQFWFFLSRHPPPPTPSLSFSLCLSVALSWSETYHTRWLAGSAPFIPPDLCPSPDPELMYQEVKLGCFLPAQELPVR